MINAELEVTLGGLELCRVRLERLTGRYPDNSNIADALACTRDAITAIQNERASAMTTPKP